MEEMLYKSIDEGKQKHEEMRAFICDFQNTNKILFKERINSLIELRFGVQELLKVINNPPTIDCKVKGVTTKGGKTTTQDAQNNDTNVHTEEPQVVIHDKPVGSNEEGKRRGSAEEVPRKPEAAPHKLSFDQGPSPNTNFVILDMPEDSRVPIILGRPFLATSRAMIDVFNKKITLIVRDDEVIFDVNQPIKRPPTKDDECYEVDDLDDMINAEVQELLTNKELDLFLLRGLEKSIDQSDLEGCEHVECKTDNDSNFDEPIRRIASINTLYPVVQETTKHVEDRKRTPLFGAIAWKMSNIKGISPLYCTYKILMEDDFKPVIQSQRRLNLKVQDVVNNKIVKLLDSDHIYPISDSSWVSPIHVVPKKGGMTVVLNDDNELIPFCIVTGWRVCIDFRKLNNATRKDHFPFPLSIRYHLSRLENPDLGTFIEEEIADEFLDEHLMVFKTEFNNNEPWYADYVNYLVGKIVPPNWTPKKRRRFFSQVKNYFWDEPYAFKLFPNNITRRCVAGNKIFKILAHCHSGLTGGHHSASMTGRKVYKFGFFWPSIFEDAKIT
uniref:Transposon Ty3-I Gag-Pol polyprotein n=1 Tax=Tanacetum cinerariifolium TaxID=118510 RepID=A0A699HA75_TANCI|nr:transposon Ty3-I Gag-Pol polyprotein [Tanacetum cinerariifolium]